MLVVIVVLQRLSRSSGEEFGCENPRIGMARIEATTTGKTWLILQVKGYIAAGISVPNLLIKSHLKSQEEDHHIAPDWEAMNIVTNHRAKLQQGRVLKWCAYCSHILCWWDAWELNHRVVWFEIVMDDQMSKWATVHVISRNKILGTLLLLLLFMLRNM